MRSRRPWSSPWVVVRFELFAVEQLADVVAQFRLAGADSDEGRTLRVWQEREPIGQAVTDAVRSGLPPCRPASKTVTSRAFAPAEWLRNSSETDVVALDSAALGSQSALVTRTTRS